MISIFLNSRKRVSLVKDLLLSLQNNTSNVDELEVFIRVDDDDHESIEYLDAESESKFSVNFTVGKRPLNLHESMNELATMTSGELLFVLNDDTAILTKDWDTKLKDIDADDCLYIKTHDNSVDKVTDKDYASFPILTRPAYEALGYFMSERFVGLGGDVHLWRVFNCLDRIVDSDIFIDHIMHRTVNDVVHSDEVAWRMRYNSWNDNVDPWSIDISQDLERITGYISDKFSTTNN